MFNAKNPFTVIAGVLAVLLFGITAVVMLALVGENLSAGAKTIIIGTILSNVFGLIPAILALQRTEAVQHDIRNGVIKNKVKDAIVEVAADTDAEGVYLQTKREGDSNG